MFDRRIAHNNDKISNTYYDRGTFRDLGLYTCPDGRVRNFLISGGVSRDRHVCMMETLSCLAGRAPLIVIHGNDPYAETAVVEAWRNAPADGKRPLAVAGVSNRLFEPFLGMSIMQTIACLRVLALKLGYTPQPSFERVVRAHITILENLRLPISLSGFYYLTEFRDMGKFRANICALPCGEEAGARLWADLGVDTDISQLDLFRAVITNLAGESAQSGWDPGRSIGTCNCITAIREGKTFVLSVDPAYITLLMPYLVEELKAAGICEYMMILDNVAVCDEMMEHVSRSGANLHCALCADNAVECFAGDEEKFQRFGGKMNSFVFMKHVTAKAAGAVAELCGKFDRSRAEVSEGTGRGFFNILPEGRHSDVRYSTENTYRIMPETIMGLVQGQAVIYDAAEDRIIYFN